MSISEDRIERERAFHNDRFSEETRAAQGKYYLAIRDGADRFNDRVINLARGADVLEYGCGNANQARSLAPLAQSVRGIDISDVAIAEAAAEAKAEGLDNVGFAAMNAEAMEFADASFDLVFGRGIVHHLDLDRCFGEIARVLRPGGTALFWEPLGHNLLLNGYRALTPNARTPDEHPLLARDFDLAKRYFGGVETRFYGLTSLAAVPFGDSKLGGAVLKASAGVDRALFRIPGLKWQAWYCMIELTRPLRAG
ncbi:MAG: class I SAM-dependent methyltransferase [Hyphomonadaceae bacterium]